MDFIVTEAGVHHVVDGGLELVRSPSRVFELACTIIWQRDCAAREGDGRGREQSAGRRPAIVREYASPPCYAHEIDPAYKDT
jgi:hypothetical protein